MAKASVASGASTILFQVQRSSGTSNITGGVDVNFEAEWTAGG